MKKPKPFATEADLCARFIAAINEDWTAYAETAGWDILLVRKIDGFQIGIQAKLKLNPFVLAQALDESTYSVDRPGPDSRAVLVPWSETQLGLEYLCAYIGITIIRVESAVVMGDKRRYGHRAAFRPDLPNQHQEWSTREWFEQAPTIRCKLPAYVPDVAAGASAPVQLTDWKIRALKIEAIIELRGFVTRKDFATIQIDHRRWMAVENRWLKVVDGHFVDGDRPPRFKNQHPKVYEQIKAEAPKWMPTAEPKML